MMTKSFVSIYVTPTKLQILKLSSGKKSVSSVATVDLPSGLIKNFKVSDSNALSKILKSAWKKLHIKERFVGLVIPEFAAFNKLVVVPKLTGNEFNDAVQWQIQEYLPNGFTDTIIDWKIVRKTGKEAEVLCVVAPKNVVMGYIEAVETAGLFPVFVTTPSVVLSKVINNANIGSLTIFKGETEGLILLTQGERVLGSAVISGNESEEIIRTAKRIVKHYDEVAVEKVLLGGMGVSPELAQLLETELKLLVARIAPKIGGLTDEGIQEYLLPIALQFEDIAEPQDVEVINLVPPSLIQKYKSAKKRIQVWGLTIVTTIIVWLCFFSTLGTYIYLNTQTQIVSDKLSANAGSVKSRQETLAIVKDINTTVDSISKIRDVTVHPITILNDIKSALPQEVTLSNYEFLLDEGVITVEGIAADRTRLIEFKQNLEKNVSIGNVSIPISSLESEVDVQFELTYKYLPVSDKQ